MIEIYSNCINLLTVVLAQCALIIKRCQVAMWLISFIAHRGYKQWPSLITAHNTSKCFLKKFPNVYKLPYLDLI